MKRIFLIFSLCLIGAGCTITKTGQVIEDAEPSLPAPAKAVETPHESTLDHEVEAEKVVVAPKSSRDDKLEEGMALMSAGELRKARMALSIAITRNLSEAEENEALSALKEINGKLFMAWKDGGDLEFYEVVPGDSLSVIAKNKGTTVEMIQRLNGLKDTKLAVGQRLKLLKGTFSVTVWRDRFIMDLKLDGAFIKRYRVGLGVEDSTPLGEFTIKNRIPEPADGSYPFGHPKHRLGHRWLGMRSEQGHKGYGVHGCRAEEESQIGTACSQGCIRMGKDDLDEFYDIVPTGTKITIMERQAGPVVSK